MKGTRRSKVWLALGLVAMACLVLAGCPHNNLLDNSGSGGGNGAGGGRGGGGGVQLVITNFAVETQGANRSASWLNGPSKMIAPEHIDLTNDTERNKYIFVVTGSNGYSTYGPAYIDIAASGEAALDITDKSGAWNITVDAYSVDLLKAQPTIKTNTDRNTIKTGNTAEEIAAVAAAKVLSGSATVNLDGGGNRTVTLYLTNDAITGAGEVNIAVYFSTATDVTEIFTNGDYKVIAELIDPVTQQPVVVGTDSTKQTLWDSQLSTDTDPGHAFDYRVHDGTQYQNMQIQTALNTRKVLAYNPKTAVPTTAIKVPKGKYLLKVTVEDIDTGTTMYRVDPAVYVDGNRTTTAVFEIKELLGKTPTAPTNFEVAWTAPTSTDQQIGFNAVFTWGQSDIYAAGYTIQLADITDIYRLETNNKQIKVNGGTYETFVDATKLWQELDNTQKIPDPTKYVTTLDWQTAPQYHREIPRWEAGSLLAGNGTLTLRLATGRIYTARIKAVNGSNSGSAWVYIGGGAGGGGVTPTKFTAPQTHGIFNLMRFSYNLLGTLDMWTLVGNAATSMKVNDGRTDTKVDAAELLKMHEYIPGGDVKLDYRFTGDTVATATTDDNVLTPTGSDDIVQTWLGWKDVKTGTLYGPASGLKAGGAWTKDDWKYTGFADLDLEPAGAGGSALIVKAETAGTFDVLNLKTIGFGAADAPATGNDSFKTLENLTEYNGGTAGTADVYKNAAGTKLVVVMQRTGGPTYTYTDLPVYISVGDNDTDKVAATLTDKNGNPITVRNVVASVGRNGRATKFSGAFTQSTADVPAYSSFSDTTNSLKGMAAGEYTLEVKVATGQGYDVTYQLPMVLLYTDQVATTNTID